MTKRPLNPRQKARRIALQALYSWELSGNSLASLVEDLFQTVDMEEGEESEAALAFFQGYDEVYLKQILEGLPKIVGNIDEAISPFLSRKIKEVNPVELTILRIAFFELQSRSDIPYKVVINEAIDIAKEFGADQSHKFINGVLDKAARTLRP